MVLLHATTLLLLLTCTVGLVPAPHATYRRSYHPSISKLPVTHTFLRESSNKAGKLYTITSSSSNYTDGPVMLIKLVGTPSEAGRAYGELLSDEIQSTYKSWFPTPSPQLEATLDWLFNCSLRPQSPPSLLEEIDAVEPISLRQKLVRVLTGSTMPADANNIQTLIQRGIAAHGNIGQHCIQSGKRLLSSFDALSMPKNQMLVDHDCDFFAAWGNVTVDGRLLSTRNLDIRPGTGISKFKLIAVYNLSTDAHSYVNIGFAGFIGSLAGMSKQGMTVSEANLDNGDVSFDGIAWPMRLREILSTAHNLTHALDIWHSKNNTAAFNFLIASGKEQRAVALETNFHYTSEFYGNSNMERDATFRCENGTVTDGHTCHWPFNNGEAVSIGMPLKEAVFRSNHGLAPNIMSTQEPLWNDTVMRYLLLHDRIVDVSGTMDVEEAVGIVSLLGIKGEDYGSCRASNFLTGDPTHVLSIVYDPSKENMYVAWEDGTVTAGTNADWRPAACNEYLWFNMSEFW